MSRKRLGDLLREEAGKPTPETAPAAKPPAARKPATTKAAGTEPSESVTTEPQPKTKPPAATQAKAKPQPEPEAKLEPETQPEPLAEPVADPNSQLQAQLAELQAKLQAQSEHLHELEVAQRRRQNLETELATAKKTILQLTDINQSLATQPAKPATSPAPATSATPVASKPLATPTTPAQAKPAAQSTPAKSTPAQPKQLVEHPALHLRPLEPPKETTVASAGNPKGNPASPSAQAYRFERIGWKPLSNHLLTAEQPHKLSDEDLGWVD